MRKRKDKTVHKADQSVIVFESQKKKKTWESIEPITANEVLQERLVNGGYTTRHLPPSSRGLVPISSGGKCNHSKLVKGLNHLWFL